MPYIPPPDPQFGADIIAQRQAGAAPPPYPGYMSPADLLAAATKAITDAYAPQIAAMQAQQKTLQQRNLAQQAGLVELYKILAGGMSGLGGQISGYYNDAAQGLNLPSDAVTNDLGTARSIVSSGAAQGPGYGSAYPQLAGQQGQVEFLKAVQDANAQEGDISTQIQKLIAEEPGKVQELLQQLQGQQADYAKAAQPIIRSAGGSVIAIDPTTGKVQVLYQGAGGAGGPPKTFGGPGGSKYAWVQDKKGNWVPTLVVPGSDPAAKPPPTVKGPNGRVDAWVQNKDGSWSLVPVRKGTGPKPGKPSYWTDGAGNRHMTTDDGTDTIIVPAGPKTTTPPTAAVIKAGWKSIADSYYHAPGSSKRLTDAEIQRKLNVVNAARAKKDLPPITIDLLSRMSSEQRRLLGIAGQRRNPQDVYIDLVHSGIPAKRAWGMVRKYYPEWGKGYFSGKASAAGQAAYNPDRAQRQTQSISYTDWPDMIRSGAIHYGLDPLAVLAVANAEGIGGGVGDNGTSFGPFQLHVGGALPRGKTQAWAESPAGIDYALRKIAAIARGLTAREAIEAIVRLFERPADPQGEIERAWAYYQSQFV